MNSVRTTFLMTFLTVNLVGAGGHWMVKTAR